MKRSFSVRKKIILGFGVMLVALGLIVIWSVSGVTRLVGNAKNVIAGNQLKAELIQREIDHLNWAKKVSTFLTDASVAELAVETDPHKCAFGQWYYSDARKKAEASIPDLKPALAEIETFHNELHASAAAIKDVYQRVDATKCNLLRDKKIAHLTWLRKVQEGLLDTSVTRIGVEQDPTKCSLGQCLYDEEKRKTLAVDPQAATLLKEIEVPHRKLHESLQTLNALLIQNKRKEAQAAFTAVTRKNADAAIALLDSLIGIVDDQAAGRDKAMRIYAGQTKPALDQIQRLLGQIRETAGNHVLSDDGMVQTANRTRQGVAILGGITLLLGLVFSWRITRNIVQSLSGMIESLKQSVSQIGMAAHQVASSSQALSENTAEQAASIEETAANLAQLGSHATANAEESSRTQEVTTRAGQAMAATLESMLQTRETILAMSNASSKISAIIKTIEEIAFQTNLLALNAAVEAARAGEHGKGFAVVAEEVRNLAQRAGNAAHETSTLIQASVSQAEMAATYVAKTSTNMEHVSREMDVVTRSIMAINTASHEQSGGITQINQTMTSMNDLTRHVASSSEEAAQTAEELTAQAEQLNLLVAGLVQLAGSAAAR